MRRGGGLEADVENTGLALRAGNHFFAAGFMQPQFCVFLRFGYSFGEGAALPRGSIRRCMGISFQACPAFCWPFPGRNGRGKRWLRQVFCLFACRKPAVSEKNSGFLELVVGIEPTACSLRVSCSTSEPHQRKRQRALRPAVQRVYSITQIPPRQSSFLKNFKKGGKTPGFFLTFDFCLIQ